MCGIVGIFAAQRDASVDAARLSTMRDTLAHRGPDGEGLRLGPGYGLGHRRLAIVDVAHGAQPMSDGEGRIWVTFNGEIYNHEALRAELEADGYVFRTRCDTEVLVHGFRAWGADLPRRLHGMFALAIVDEAEHTLFLARDRMGQKPVHYIEVDGQWLFASELKALLEHPRVARRIDPEALHQYLCLGYVPDPRTIFLGVHKLPPASSLLVTGGRAQLSEYWCPPLPVTADPRPVGEQQSDLLARFDAAVAGRLMGEVPLGAFLSGGVDSFAVVDSMRRAQQGRVLACTVGFDEPAYDERAQAREAAAACGAELHEDVLRVGDMLDLDWFATVFDEPFADSSAIPTYHVSRMARRHVTVALSGDGGDESFAGYRRYWFDHRENQVRGLLPRPVWGAAGALYPKLDFLPRFLRFKRTLQNLALAPEEAYARSVSAALPEEVAPLLRPGWRTDDPLAPVRAAHREAEGCHPLIRCAHADRRTWLPGDILTKVDRASMAVSLEVRSPFLDHRIVELALSLGGPRLLLGGERKGFLRAALAGRLGRAALDRPKRGFSVPLIRWMRGTLGDALSAGLADGPLADFVEVEAVRDRLAAHRAGRRDHSRVLWALLVFDRFLRRWMA